VVLDAVGVGATRLRDLKASEILDTVRIDVIKGNASEIARLAGEKVITRGVESTEFEADLIAVAEKLAFERSATVVITGKEDVIAGGKQVFLVKNGHALMGSIVGTGCMAASVIGAFAAVEPNHARAAAAALSCYGIAGEIAASQSKGPGSFKENFYDAVYNLDRDAVKKMSRVEER
jgi:hydroxyethylthiazole kinase